MNEQLTGSPLLISKRLSLQAEVQSFYADGAIALHTRSLKYGKVSKPYLCYSTPVGATSTGTAKIYVPFNANTCCPVQLANGQIVEVPPNLIKRQKQHFTTLEGTGMCIRGQASLTCQCVIARLCSCGLCRERRLWHSPC